MEIKLPCGVYTFDERSILGRAGGFGQVFLGETKDGAQVAIKRLHIENFAYGSREIELVSRLVGKEFRGVIPFIDAGLDAESQHWFVVMEKAEFSLEKFVDERGVQQPDAAARILKDIASGLSEIDDLVHRDLKPANILFHEGVWKIADLGIARLFEEMTSSNTLKGFLSPQFASPEQFRLERATRASDLYSFGCIAYFLLAGAPPFIDEPARAHQFDPIPIFACSDGRLATLIHLLLRKLPETRPGLPRVHQILDAIISSPLQDKQLSGQRLLGEVGARVTAQEQLLDAEQEQLRQQLSFRAQTADQAWGFLRDNFERLWGKIHSASPAAERVQGQASPSLHVRLGTQ